MKSNHRAVGFRWCPRGIVERRGLAGRVERYVDHCAQVHAIILLKGERREYLVGFRRVGQAPGDELEQPAAGGRFEDDAEVRRVDRVGAAASRLTGVRTNELCYRGHLG